MKYVTGYTGYDGNGFLEHSGNYLALKVDTNFDKETVLVGLYDENNTYKGVSLDEDRDLVFRITNKDTQFIRVTVDDGETFDKTYALTGLTLKTE